MKFNRMLAVIVLVVLVGVLLWGLKLAHSPHNAPLQGQIEAREYHVSSKLAGRIEEVMVRRGDKVAAGDLLYVINSPEANAKLMQAEGGRDAARAMQLEADKGARKQQIAAEKDQWLKAKAAAELAKTTYERVNNLFKDGVLARQKRDEAYTQYLAAKYTEQAALAVYQMTQEGARVETKAAAAGNAQMAEAMVKEVTAVLADSEMRAPKAGEVSEVLLHASELAPVGFPVVTLVDMSDAWAVFQLREDALKDVKIGEVRQLYIPALDVRAEFKVNFMAVMGDFATWRSTETGHDFDLRTFEVELVPQAPIAGLRAGMSVVWE